MTNLKPKLKDLEKLIIDPTQEDLEVLDGLGKRIKKLELYERWMQNPITKEFISSAVKRIQTLNQEILSDSTEDIKLLKLSRRFWSELLDIVSSKSENESLINQDIEEGLLKFKDYLNG